MLELKSIKKDYILKDQEPVHALKGVSLRFRKNEFVAILGHSGCGKTTLLNITGGLDHYDDGDLIIKGISTKDFSDRDWDTYRNHSIGFVFQSYNLISHQSIAKNVELALTIAGISKQERIKRAHIALDKVGLAGLYNKKPNQLSGGQMQRVAIARALVNNPEIVLADEPTGALDSETSVQIMDLLKEVAQDHLVIMVTHNPDLAEQYASRIVRMKDGLITDDSNPYEGEDDFINEAVEEKEVSKGNKKKSSMSFLTAVGLSVSNLFSKLNRTILVSLAGSIGIIGVSTILGVSSGVNNYIHNMENDMLSSYPLTIAEETVDMTSLLSGLANMGESKNAKFNTSNEVGLDSMITYLMEKYTDFTNVTTNDITDTLMKYVEQMPKSYYASINYDYALDPTNNFFGEFYKTKDSEKRIMSFNGITKSYIETLMTVKGFKEYASFVDIFTNFMSQIPGDKDYVLSQYDMIAGSKYPEETNELMLVVDKNTTMTDLILAQMGYYDEETFLKIAKKAVKANEYQKKYKEDPAYTWEMYQNDLKALDNDPMYQYKDKFTFDELLNREFYYFPHQTLFKTEGLNFVSHNQATLSMSGLYQIPAYFPADRVKPFVPGETYNFIIGVNYDSGNDALTGTLIVLDSSNNITLNTPVLFNRDSDYDSTKSVVDGSWSFEYNGANLGLTVVSDNKQESEGAISYSATGTLNLLVLPIDLTSGKIDEIIPDTKDFWYSAYPDASWLENPSAVNGSKVSVTAILRAKNETNFGCLRRGVYYTQAFRDLYRYDASNSDIITEFKRHLTKQNFKVSPLNAYVSFKYDDYTEDDGSETFVPDEKDGYSSALNSTTSSAISNIFASFLSGGGDNLKIDKEHLRSLSGLKVLESETELVDDLSTIDFDESVSYSTIDVPISISIYPHNFTTKDSIKSYLNKWNSNQTLVIDDQPVEKVDRDDITVTDTISVIIVAISTLVTTVSIALIAFTSLSLVVSCFMIAVITFISVMERIKEIGVIRSLGGRKRDVSALFIAENLITGFASGTIGIIITYVLQIIINAIVNPLGVTNICALPWYLALLMIGIAVFLSVISGLIPSIRASKQDPVIALRSE